MGQRYRWEFSGRAVVRTPTSLPRAQVQSLVRELRSCAIWVARKKNKKKPTPQKNKPRDNGVRGSAENWLSLGVSWAAGGAALWASLRYACLEN